ncbi:hypothetical protein HMI54_001260 [Coelomomyces lativittatus]|nr:hypothetical protein HMI54_001260 [Coelomomyces lativittatus]
MITELKKILHSMTTERAELRRTIDQLKLQVLKKERDKQELQSELRSQAIKVADLHTKYSKVGHEQDKISELRFLLQRQIKHNEELTNSLNQLTERLSIVEAYCKERTFSIHERDQIIEHQQQLIKEISEKNDVLSTTKSDLQFQLDEKIVLNIKLEKTTHDAVESEEQFKKAAERMEMEKIAIGHENEQLRNKLKDLVQVSDELAKKFDELCATINSQRKECNNLKEQLEHAKNLFSKLNTDNSQLITQIEVATKQRTEANEKARHLELVMTRKERELSEMLNKIDETVQDYESVLKKKDEQMWAITEKFQEEVAQNRLGQTELEKEKIAELERKIEAQAKTFQMEIDTLLAESNEKNIEILHLSKKTKELELRQFEPRMERLHAIEKDFKLHLEEYMLSEESLENGLICPKCLQFFNVPYTLMPCGHTYCKPCIDEMKDEHYNKLFCAECPQVPVDQVFRNEALESLTERFNRRKSMVLSMINWIKVLKVFVPDSIMKTVDRTNAHTIPAPI